MPENHPLRRGVRVLQWWLIMFALMMLWNACVANGYVLTGVARPLPFLFLAAAAMAWAWFAWCNRTVIGASSIIAVGTALRGTEIMLWSESEIPGRLTAISLWFAMAGTALAFGVLNIIAISRKEADEWIHHH
jgi:hypothetical protein